MSVEQPRDAGSPGCQLLEPSLSVASSVGIPDHGPLAMPHDAHRMVRGARRPRGTGATFVYESLKNYFQKEGLRVFSAIHPIFSVRRQWERIVWIGGPREDGSRELYCQFRIERVEARDRLRRIEHQVFSVLKTVFLGVTAQSMANSRNTLVPPHSRGLMTRQRSGVTGTTGRTSPASEFSLRHPTKKSATTRRACRTPIA